MSPARLLADLARARRLKHADAAPRPTPPRAERIVVTLTSIPERVANIAPVIRSLRDQTVPADLIRLNWQKVGLKTPEPYPPPPVVEGADVAVCDCSGPAAKLLPTLLAEPDALIIVVDDDIIYPRDFIQTLLEAHRADPRAVLGYRGWRVEPNVNPRDFDHVFATAIDRPEDVDILIGTWGYILPPGLLGPAVQDFSGWPHTMRFVDDVWIAGHLMRAGAHRRVIPARGLPLETTASGIGSLSEGPNRSGENDSIAIAAFAPWR